MNWLPPNRQAIHQANQMRMTFLQIKLAARCASFVVAVVNDQRTTSLSAVTTNALSALPPGFSFIEFSTLSLVSTLQQPHNPTLPPPPPPLPKKQIIVLFRAKNRRLVLTSKINKISRSSILSVFSQLGIPQLYHDTISQYETLTLHLHALGSHHPQLRHSRGRTNQTTVPPTFRRQDIFAATIHTPLTLSALERSSRINKDHPESPRNYNLDSN